jgi:two-component system CheB/CheR fusion protein
VDLRRALHEAKANNERVAVETRLTEDGKTRGVEIEVLPIIEPDTKSRCYLVLFHEPKPRREMPSLDAPPPPSSGTPEDERRLELERELMVTKEYLQSTIEELESANEELKSSNEELQSSNEELQSTNEELETSKEELQSSNEELTTVNDELQNRMGELQLTNDDLHNILVGIGEAIVIIGMDLRIRRYTQTAEKLLNLVPGDVGRSVSQLNAFIVGHRIEELAAKVIERLTPIEERVRCADQRWYDLRVSPYRTLDHSIKGALIVLVSTEATEQASGSGDGTPAPRDPAAHSPDPPNAKPAAKPKPRGKAR